MLEAISTIVLQAPTMRSIRPIDHVPGSAPTRNST